MSNYRLRPKPGVVKAGRIIQTSISPIIIINKPKTGKSPVAMSKIPEAQQVQRVIIRKPLKPPVKAQRPKIKGKPGRLRQRKEVEIGRYKKDVELLKNSGAGRILIMVACGPSILEVDLPKLKGHPLIDFMSINKPDPRLGTTKYWVFCDQSQYTRNKDLFESWQGTIINAWSVRARHQNQVLVRNISGKGFSKNLVRGYHIGRSTTFANMQTAFWMNYDKVYIFGCDMSKSTDLKKLHFYGTNPDVKPEIRVSRFQKEAEHYLIGANKMTPAECQKFTFCSSYNTWPFIEKFEKLDHKEAVDIILERAESMLKQK